MRAFAFAVFLGGACLAATVASANLELVPIPESESRVDFSRTALHPTEWALIERARYAEVVRLTNGHVSFFYSDSSSLAFRDSHPVDFRNWFRTLDIDGVKTDDAKLEIHERQMRAGPMTYAFVLLDARTCIAFRVAVGKAILYNLGYPGHEALLRGVICENDAGEAAEAALLAEAGAIQVRQ